jgi:phosphoribosylanthranilate isomerase
MINIKICGITNIKDAKYISNFNIWALGYVFYKKSLRYLKPEKAAEIIKVIKKKNPNILHIGVVVNEDYKNLNKIVCTSKIDMIQFHGDEDLKFCKEFKFPFIKAIRLFSSDDLKFLKSWQNFAKHILIDSYDKDKRGGTGKICDWNLAQKINIPYILAGGLNIQNINKALQFLKPFALDISSGVEKSPGIKDYDKIKQIMYCALKFDV